MAHRNPSSPVGFVKTGSAGRQLKPWSRKQLARSPACKTRPSGPVHEACAGRPASRAIRGTLATARPSREIGPKPQVDGQSEAQGQIAQRDQQQ